MQQYKDARKILDEKVEEGRRLTLRSKEEKKTKREMEKPMEREGAWPGEEDVERENWRRRGSRVRDGVETMVKGPLFILILCIFPIMPLP